MRILPITFKTHHRADFKNNHEYDYSLNKRLIQSSDIIIFSGNEQMTAKAFKKLGKYMTDLYTGEKMLTAEQLKSMKKRGFFRGPISEMVRKVTPYKDKYLEPVELEVFKQIEKAALETPEIDLSQLFKQMYVKTRANFRRTQRPIFDEIKTLGAQLPQEYMQKFFKFMEITDRKLYDEPIRQEFSLKEFSYKVSNILERMTDINLKNRIQKLLELLSDENFSNNTKPLSKELVKKVFDFKNMKVPGKKTAFYERNLKQYEWNKDAVRIKIIEAIRDSVSERGFKKFERLCQDNIDMINGKPVHIAFSNKTFAYDLEKTLTGLENIELKEEMLTLARNLPTSSNSPEAMMLKFRDTDPDIIGDRLFNPALVSIEHMKPESLGGETLMYNCALAKRGLNSERGNRPLWLYLTRFNPKNQNKYAKNLVKLNHRGLVKYKDALKHLETLETEGHLDLKAYKEMLKEVESPVEAIKRKFAKKS